MENKITDSSTSSLLGKNIRFTIGEVKRVKDYSGLPVFKWRRNTTKRGRAMFWAEGYFNKRKRLKAKGSPSGLAILVRYGKFKDNFGKMTEFTNWGEYDNFKDFRQAFNAFLEKSNVEYICS